MSEMIYLGNDEWECSICGIKISTKEDMGDIYHDCEIEEMIENLSALHHEEWIYWSKGIAEEEKISEERLNRWKHYWVPYAVLPESAKAFDRLWARKALDIIEKKE